MLTAFSIAAVEARPARTVASGEGRASVSAPAGVAAGVAPSADDGIADDGAAAAGEFGAASHAARGLDHLDEIMDSTDAAMIDRGDLSVETTLETLTLFQKRIIDAARHAGKPVIVATHMLESMIENPLPTRAEITDVANAVFEEADAIMLSGETSVGEHPITVVETMARIIEHIETNALGQLPTISHEQDAADTGLVLTWAATEIGAAFKDFGRRPRAEMRFPIRLVHRHQQ